MDKNIDFERIHQYLQGELTDAEKAAFEAAMNADASLRAEVELEKSLLAALPDAAAEMQARQQLRATSERLRAEGFFAESEPPAARPAQRSFADFFNSRNWMALAAGLVAVLAAVWFFGKKTAAADPKTLFARHFSPQNDLAQSAAAALESFGLAGVQTAGDSVRQALQLYETGKYDEAIGLLKPLLESHPLNDTAQYFLALAHMSRERYAKASELLRPLSTQASSAYKLEASWNLGLCYLMAENSRRDAAAIFEDLSKKPDFRQHRAAQAMFEMLK